MSTESREKAQNERDIETTDKAKLAARAAVAAGEAYLAGNVDAAVAMYKQAGDLLVECIPLQVKPGERDFVRLLATANYYKGGHYDLAVRQISRIKAGRLKKEFRATCGKFRKVCKERTAPDYRKKIGDKLRDLVTARDYEGVLALLDEHPYALPTATTAQLRFRFANLAGLLSAEEVAAQEGVDLAEVGLEAADPFKLPPGMRRSVVTGDLEPDPDYVPEGAQAPDQICGQDVLRKTLFGD